MIPYFTAAVEVGLEFPVDDLKRELAKNPNVILHPGRKKPTFVVCEGRESAARRLTQFLDDPMRPFDTNGMIILETNVITVYLPGHELINRQIEAFLLPVLREHPCRIVDGDGRNLTEEFAGRLEDLFRA